VIALVGAGNIDRPVALVLIGLAVLWLLYAVLVAGGGFHGRLGCLARRHQWVTHQQFSKCSGCGVFR